MAPTKDQIPKNQELLDDHRTKSKRQTAHERYSGKRKKTKGTDWVPPIVDHATNRRRLMQIRRKNQYNQLFSSTRPHASPFLTPHRHKITNGLEALKSLGYSIGPIQKRTNILAHDALHGFGLTAVKSMRTQLNDFDYAERNYTKDFSLISTQTAEIRFRNTQLITEDTYSKTPQLITPKGFTDQTDPFYQLDDARPRMQQQMSTFEKQYNMPDMIQIASGICVFHERNKHSKYLNHRTKPVWSKELI
tara:strand:- start:2020 stop:2763 length:744 start_codon:yes stop_codon:yes gene_type:complete